MSDNSLARELAELVVRLHQAPDTTHTAAEVVQFACQQFDADYAGITLIKQRRQFQTVAPTDPLVEEADRLQHELNEGPCHDSALQGDSFVSQDLAADERWPLWAPRAVELGLRSALGTDLPGQANGHRIGSLNLFWTQPRDFSSSDVEFAHLLTRHAAFALASSIEVEGLTLALDGRKRIGQAEGILMERHKLTEEQAFAVLKRYSNNHNIKLRDLADQVVQKLDLPKANA
ncbi:antitermination regulator [Serinibacter arcticus]|uniref:Antitermination regulator n=1 Tax=Serinibacter arcticus TaxID=1655435 RepID=A0A2U1ZYF5_9MICO|nr:GAF and ANTAR domain-containing protein [Serinibacter arcticus]PWD52028.1 antitermination regulator [Serinibacter arcticus]